MAEDNTTDERPTLMLTTPGVTSKRFCRLPLGSEGEMTPGDDRANPFRSIEECEYVEEVERKQKEREDDELFKTGNPVGGSDDPFIFDDIGESEGFDLPEFGQPQDVDPLGIEAFDSANNQGPRF